MKIAISTDEYFPLIKTLIDEVEQRGHEVIYFGPKEGEASLDWPHVTLRAIEQICERRAEEAIILCWTGTGCTIAANKVPGIRAALCHDAETAKGARIWNHANVLSLSLRTTSPAILKEILTAWFETPFSSDEWNLCQIKQIEEIEKLHPRF
jgi:ribose 5-phosphate isomerase B